MKRFAPFVLVFALAACNTTTPAKVLITGCESYGRSLTNLAPYKATMSPARVARVDEIIKYTHPFCAKDRPLPLDPATEIAYVSPVATELAQLLFDLKG